MYIERNGKRITTRQMQREQDQLNTFQKEMNDFDLSVQSGTSGSYNKDGSRFYLEMRTMAEPTKGNKDLIAQLIADGYKVEKSSRDDATGRRYYVFIVVKTVEIETANGADVVAEEPIPKPQPQATPRIYSYTVRREDGLTIGSVGVKEQAINAAKAVAAMTGRCVSVIAHRTDGTDRENVYSTDGLVRKLWKEPKEDQPEKPTAREYPTLFGPTAGETYTNHGGGIFRCLHASGADATMMNMASGWTLEAHMCRQYKDGTIEWDWSTGGHFA